jgi:hypothetical protein
MGLLDDAIREHLELKRRTGADPEEVSRQEREALGPVVRGEELVTDITSGDGEGVSSEYEAHGPDFGAYDHAEAFQPGVELEAHADEFEALPEESDHGAAERAPVSPPPHAGQPTEEFDVEAIHAAEERPPARAAEPTPPKPAEPEREQAAHAAPGSDGEHDVLEETPDFLQETPEHDRLWFEQAPPQDFDFDK